MQDHPPHIPGLTPPGPALHCHVMVSCDHVMDGRGRLAFSLTKSTLFFLVPVSAGYVLPSAEGPVAHLHLTFHPQNVLLGLRGKIRAAHMSHDDVAVVVVSSLSSWTLISALVCSKLHDLEKNHLWVRATLLCLRLGRTHRLRCLWVAYREGPR